MRENNFQSKLISDIKKKYPGCIILKNDARYKQGIPDIIILYKNKWAMLECKVRKKEQPNQPYYISKLNKMSFARFINPMNKEDVLHDLQSTFGS